MRALRRRGAGVRAWLERRRRRQAAQLVADVLVPMVQERAQRASASERAGFHQSARLGKREAYDLAETLRLLELELVGQELTLWVGEL